MNADADAPTGTNVVTTHWCSGSEITPVYAVISAVAEATGTDPYELSPLYKAVDPEALDRLLDSRPGTSVSVIRFRYAGYEICVEGCGEVSVFSVDPSHRPSCE